MLWAVLWLCLPAAAHAADSDDPDRAAKLKAAYLFNFVKFVQWPNAKAEDAIVVCFLGRSRVQRALTHSAEGKKAGGRVLTVRDLEPTRDLQGCSMLYVDAGAAGADQRLAALDPTVPLLTVSDSSGFARAGGMIELFSSSNRLQFNINVDAARRAGLTVSSSLLQLAASVKKASEQ